MALSKEIIEESEFAKTQLMSSSLDERCKKQMLHLLNISMTATNGISVEEKIQKITEAIHGLVITQFTFLDSVDKKIAAANREQCKACKAMKHADDVELQKQKEQLIEEWKKANGYDNHTTSVEESSEDSSELSWSGVIKKVLTQPGIWILGIVMTISPYGVDIVKALLEFFSH